MKLPSRTRMAGAAILLAAALPWASGCRDQGSTAAGAKWQQKENWRQIRPGMHAEQVRAILGEPSRVDRNPAFESWHYGEGTASGKIVFAGGMIKDWTSPR